MSNDKPNNAAQDAAPANGAPTLESLQAENVQLKAKADEYLELAKRAKADFINYQDRVRRDKGDWNRQALEGFVREMLPAMDGFALAKFEDPKLLEAVRILEKEFLRVLAKTGVTPIETAGKPFDPLYHDAVAMEPGGTQIEEVRRGWLFEGKVLRPASVRIVKAKEEAP